MGGRSTSNCQRPARGALWALWWHRTHNNHNKRIRNNNVKNKSNSSNNSNNSNNCHNISNNIINNPHNIMISKRPSHNGSWRSGYSHPSSPKRNSNTPRCPPPS